MADALVEQISAVVLDGGEPLSFRSLGAAAQVDAAASSRALEQFARSHGEQVAALRVSIERQAGAADPRARVLRLHAGAASGESAAGQMYALYRKQQGEGEGGGEQRERVAVACWAQERRARGEIFAQVQKHAPMSGALRAFYASDVACAEATARTEFGDAKGEETVSAFDAVSRPKKPAGSSAFFKNPAAASSASASATAAPSKSSASASSSSSSFFGKSSASKSASSTMVKPTANTTAKPDVKRVNAESMSNVLSVDSSDEESDKEETDAPAFVKKSGSASRSKRVISDDDEDMEEMEAAPAKRSAKASSASKRKLQASKPDEEERRSSKKDEPEEQSPKKARILNEEDIVVPTKRRVLVNKTRITPEGYMVTEKTYEEHELTPQEIESERQAAVKKQRAAADRAAKASKEKAQTGPRKQKDLRSFFMKN